LKDIEKSFGFVPGFLKGLPQDVLIQDWPLAVWSKRYQALRVSFSNVIPHGLKPHGLICSYYPWLQMKII
jgi:hypothetical protein